MGIFRIWLFDYVSWCQLRHLVYLQIAETNYLNTVIFGCGNKYYFYPSYSYFNSLIKPCKPKINSLKLWNKWNSLIYITAFLCPHLQGGVAFRFTSVCLSVLRNLFISIIGREIKTKVEKWGNLCPMDTFLFLKYLTYNKYYFCDLQLWTCSRQQQTSSKKTT